MQDKYKVVVIGGGTGTSVVLSGLKKYEDVDLTAIFVVTDSGGSTGRLRDEFGFLPVGDARQCLAALADGDHQEEVRQMLLYRFGKGDGLQGHNLGNLVLTALEDMKSSPGLAIETAANIFNIKGQVLPVTEKDVDLVIHYENGQVKVGEHHLDDLSLGGKKIIEVNLSEPAHIYDKAKKAIEEADLVVMGPGDLYGSLLPNAVVEGFAEALNNSQGKFVYVVNLMTHFSQTHQMSAQEHVGEIEKYCQRYPDYVVMNIGEIPDKLKEKYAESQEYPVVDDLEEKEKSRLIKADLIDLKQYQQKENDEVPRSLLRHHREKLAQTIYEILL